MSSEGNGDTGSLSDGDDHRKGGQDDRILADLFEMGVKKRTPTSKIGQLWDRPWLMSTVTLLALSVLPAVLILGFGVARGTLWLPGDANGVLEDPNVLSYFPMVFLVVIGVRYAVERQYQTINSLWNRRLLRFASDTSYLEGKFPEYASRLTPADVQELISFYDFLLAKATFRGSNPEISCPDRYRSVYRNFRRLFFGIVLIGAVVLVTITYYHWFAIEMYGIDFWASASYPVGFFLRFVYEAVLFLVVFPVVLTQALVSMFLVYHPLKRVGESNGIQFQRFELDDASGFSQFGIQSFTNVLVLIPFAGPILMVTLFIPTTAFHIIGLVLVIVAVPLLFLAQLWSAHRALSKMQEMELAFVGEAFTENYHLYKRRLVETDTMEEFADEALVTHGEALEKSDIVFNGIKKQSTWPFDRTQLGQLASVVAFLVGIVVSLF